MNDDTHTARRPGRWSARRASIGVVAVAAAAAATMQVLGANPAASQTTTITARRAYEKPSLDPGARVWKDAPALDVQLTAQQTSYPFGGGTIPSVTAKALHFDDRLYVRVEWNDTTRDASIGAPDRFADAAAIEFPSVAGSTVPSVCMGQADGGVNIWQWRADRENPGGRWPQSAHPDAYVDEVQPFGDLNYPAKAAGNVMAAGRRPTQDLVATGFSTLSPAERQTVGGRGEYSGHGAGGRWAVVFERPFEAADPMHPTFQAGQTTDIAFAVWDGARNERNGIKSVSQFVKLNISDTGQKKPPSAAWWLLGIPAAAAVGAFGVAMVRPSRRGGGPGTGAPALETGGAAPAAELPEGDEG